LRKKGGPLVTTLHAQDAQDYACKPDAAGKFGWQFREPIGTLRRPFL